MGEKDVSENRARIVRAYYESHDAKGAQSKRYCVFCPNLNAGEKPLYALAGEMPAQMYPFEVYAFEHAEYVTQKRAGARQHFHDTRTLARIELALLTVLKLLQCSTAEVVGVLAEHGLLGGLDLRKRRLDL